MLYIPTWVTDYFVFAYSHLYAYTYSLDHKCHTSICPSKRAVGQLASTAISTINDRSPKRSKSIKRGIIISPWHPKELLTSCPILAPGISSAEWRTLIKTIKLRLCHFFSFGVLQRWNTTTSCSPVGGQCNGKVVGGLTTAGVIWKVVGDMSMTDAIGRLSVTCWWPVYGGWGVVDDLSVSSVVGRFSVTWRWSI